MLQPRWLAYTYKVARGSGVLSAGRQQAGMMKDE
jgi:hypothetical protein